MAEKPPPVCVTDVGGFITSLMVKLLLEKGYSVRETVRYPDDQKNSYLRELEGAKERLILCKAYFLDYESLRKAINGCDGVFHTVSPVTNDPVMGENGGGFGKGGGDGEGDHRRWFSVVVGGCGRGGGDGECDGGRWFRWGGGGFGRGGGDGEGDGGGWFTVVGGGVWKGWQR